MSENHKRRVQQALERHHEKLLKEDKGPQRKNKKPEKEVEEVCLKWMREKGWEVQVYESKAIYNPRAGTYTQNQGVKKGNADVQGLMPDGTSVAIELKAPGKLSTFLSDKSTPQRDFIIKRINMNGFACVVDSVERLKTIYGEWLVTKQLSPEASKLFLFNQLPQRKRQVRVDGKLFEE